VRLARNRWQVQVKCTVESWLLTQAWDPSVPLSGLSQLQLLEVMWWRKGHLKKMSVTEMSRLPGFQCMKVVINVKRWSLADVSQRQNRAETIMVPIAEQLCTAVITKTSVESDHHAPLRKPNKERPTSKQVKKSTTPDSTINERCRRGKKWLLIVPRDRGSASRDRPTHAHAVHPLTNRLTHSSGHHGKLSLSSF